MIETTAAACREPGGCSYRPCKRLPLPLCHEEYCSLQTIGVLRILWRKDMDQKTIDMVNWIMDTERMGYAYVYPSDGKPREKYLVSTTPENMANFIGSHFHDVQKIVVTDFLDRLILDTCGGFIDNCPEQGMCREIVHPKADGENRAFQRFFLQEPLGAPDARQGIGTAGRREPSKEEHPRHGNEQRDPVAAPAAKDNAAGK